MCSSITCTDTPPDFTKARRVSLDNTPPTKARKVSFAGIGTPEEEEQRTLRGHARRKARKERRQRRKLQRLAENVGMEVQFAAMEASGERELEELKAKQAERKAQEAEEAAERDAREQEELLARLQQQRERNARELEAELQRKAFDILKNPRNLVRLQEIWDNPSGVDDDSGTERDSRYHTVTGNLFLAAGCPLEIQTARAKYEWFQQDERSLEVLLRRKHVRQYLLRLGKKKRFLGSFQMVRVDDPASPASSEGSGQLHDAGTPPAVRAAVPQLGSRVHSIIIGFLPMANPALPRSPIRDPEQETEEEEVEEGKVRESQTFSAHSPDKSASRKRHASVLSEGDEQVPASVSLSESDEQEPPSDSLSEDDGQEPPSDSLSEDDGQEPSPEKAQVEPEPAKAEDGPKLNFGQQASILQEDQTEESDEDVATRYADGGHPFGLEDSDGSSDLAAENDRYYRNFNGGHFFLEHGGKSEKSTSRKRSLSLDDEQEPSPKKSKTLPSENQAGTTSRVSDSQSMDTGYDQHLAACYNCFLEESPGLEHFD